MLKRPIVTEKSMKLARAGLYTFEVDKNDNKNVIAKLISDKFKVEVVSVKTINVKGRVKSQKKVRKSFGAKLRISAEPMCPSPPVTRIAFFMLIECTFW